MINHRSWRSTMRDGWKKESCKRLRSGTRLSVLMSTAVASVSARNFLQGGSPVGLAGSHGTGDAGRLRGFLCQGADERCVIRERSRSTYMLGLGAGNLGDKGTRGGTLGAAARRIGYIFTRRALGFLTFPWRRRWRSSDLRYSGRILA
jgi:hypothetical protein